MAIKISGVNIVDDSQNLRITGVSTFTNGPILVGSATSTGTATQRLQVTGGGYVSGNIGIGITNPTEKLHVIGNASISGNLTSSDVQATSINSGPLAGFRNAIINGNFDIWQRGTSSTDANNAGRFIGPDRFGVNSQDGSGRAVTYSQQVFANGQTDVPGNPKYFFRWNETTAGTSYTRKQIYQGIEGVQTFAGQQVMLSFYAEAGSAITLPKIELGQYFGTGGSPSTFVVTNVASSVSVGTSWARYTYTLTLPSISGKTIGTAGDDCLYFELFLPTTGTFTFDVAQVQLEPGPIATTFERRPIGTELALCQRYYLKLGSVNDDDESMIGIARKSTGGDETYRGSIFTPVRMRAVPSYSGANINFLGNGTTVASSIAPTSIHGSGVFFYGDNLAGVGNEVYLLRYSFGTSGAFNAEL